MANIPQDVGRPNDPRYGNDSQPISQPKPDTSLGTIAEGFGNLINVGGKGINWLFEDSIEQELRPQLEQIRAEHTKDLEATVAELGQGKMTGLVAPEGGGDIPPDLETLTGDLNRLKAAGPKGARKLSSTDYLGRIDTLLSEYRNRFRGHTAYIDKLSSSILGVDAANARVRSLTTDANRLLAAANSGKQKTDQMLKEMLDSGDPNARVLNRQYRGGLVDDAGVADAYNKHNAYKWLNTMGEATVKNENLTREHRANKGRDLLATETNRRISDAYKALMTGAEGIPTNVSETLKAVSRGEEVDSRTLDQAGVFLTQYRNNLTQDLFNHALRMGYDKVHKDGADGVRKEIEGRMVAFDGLNTLIGKKDFDAVGRTTRYMEAYTNDVLRQTFKNPDMMDFFAKEQLLKKFGGEQAMVKFTQEMLTTKKRGSLSSWIEEKTLDATTQEVPEKRKGRDRSGSAPVTINTAMNEAIKQGFLTEDVKHDLVKMATKIQDASIGDVARLGLVTYAFHPDNHGFINRLNREAQHQVFSDLTNKSMSDQIFKLAEGNPRAAEMYSNWVQRTYRQLFQEDLKNFGQILQSENFKIGWDTDKGEFRAEPTINRSTLMPGGQAAFDRQVAFVNNTLRNINQSSKSIYNLLEQENPSNADKEAYLWNLMGDLGVDFSEATDIAGIPQKMRAAIETARVNAVTAKSKSEAAKRAEEEKARQDVRKRTGR